MLGGNMPDQSKPDQYTSTEPAGGPAASEVENEKKTREMRVAQKILENVERLRVKRAKPGQDDPGTYGVVRRNWL